jgi:hypothetical protein
MSVLIISLIIQLIIVQFSELREMKEKFFYAIQNSLKAVVIIFLIPFFFWIINYLIMGMSEFLFNIQGEDINLAKRIYLIGAPNQNCLVPDGFGYPGDESILEWNLFIEIAGSVFMLVACFLIGLLLIQRIFELFLLFLISPFIAAIFPLDEGKRLFLWKDLVIAKFIASTATILSFIIYLDVLPKMIDLIESKDFFLKQVITFLVVAAGGLSVVKAPTIFATFVGESAGISEGLGVFQAATYMFSTAKTGASFAFRALGFKNLFSKKSSDRGGNENTGEENEAEDYTSSGNIFGSIKSGWKSSGIFGATKNIGRGLIKGGAGLSGKAIGIAGKVKRIGPKGVTRGAVNLIGKNVRRPLSYINKGAGNVKEKYLKGKRKFKK